MVRWHLLAGPGHHLARSRTVTQYRARSASAAYLLFFTRASKPEGRRCSERVQGGGMVRRTAGSLCGWHEYVKTTMATAPDHPGAGNVISPSCAAKCIEPTTTSFGCVVRVDECKHLAGWCQLAQMQGSQMAGQAYEGQAGSPSWESHWPSGRRALLQLPWQGDTPQCLLMQSASQLPHRC
jgi:hypothetical protein